MKEMPMVPDKVAAARQCLDAGELAMTRKHLIRDAKAESRPAKTMAFGTAISWEHQFVPPGNRVRERWLRCENVMQDVETMDVVWKGITHLDSVKAFAKWLQDHPTVSSLSPITHNSITIVIYFFNFVIVSEAGCANESNDCRYFFEISHH